MKKTLHPQRKIHARSILPHMSANPHSHPPLHTKGIVLFHDQPTGWYASNIKNIISAQIPSKMLGLPFTRWSLTKSNKRLNKKASSIPFASRPSERSWMKRTSPVSLQKRGKSRMQPFPGTGWLEKGNPDRLPAPYPPSRISRLNKSDRTY